MGWILMSERELNRIEILSQIQDGKISMPNAARLLNLTKRQVYRLMHRFINEGPSGLKTLPYFDHIPRQCLLKIPHGYVFS